MGHSFMVAAYTLVWVIQLSYLISVATRWAKQKKKLTDNAKTR
ncbi:MAG TPA: hypothetical protein VIM62_07360 [Acidobacteriaceae bacterium]